MQRREIQPQPLFIQSRALAKDVPKDLPDIHNIKDFALLNGQTAASCLDIPCCDHAYAYQSRCEYTLYRAQCHPRISSHFQDLLIEFNLQYRRRLFLLRQLPVLCAFQWRQWHLSRTPHNNLIPSQLAMIVTVPLRLRAGLMLSWRFYYQQFGSLAMPRMSQRCSFAVISARKFKATSILNTCFWNDGLMIG